MSCSACCSLASPIAFAGIGLEGVAGWLHQRAPGFGSPIGGAAPVMPASTSATWRTCTCAPSRCSLPGHVHQAAHVAGEQGVRPGGDDVVRFLAHDLDRDLRIFDAESAAEAAADFGARQLGQLSPATLASSRRGCALTPSSRSPEQLS